jgi:hypothetical protein
MQVGAVPKDEFERLVESDDPPTVTELGEAGDQDAWRSLSLHPAMHDGAPGAPIAGRDGLRHGPRIRAFR